MADIIVNTNSDSFTWNPNDNVITLREAIAIAGPNDVIRFAAPMTIDLVGGLLIQAGQTVTIDGDDFYYTDDYHAGSDGVADVFINVTNGGALFVDAGATVNLIGLSLNGEFVAREGGDGGQAATGSTGSPGAPTGGAGGPGQAGATSPGFAAGITNFGNLTLQDVTLTGFTALGGSGVTGGTGGIGGTGATGGPAVKIHDSTGPWLAPDGGKGGHGGNGGTGGDGQSVAGALYNAGALTLIDTAFQNNYARGGAGGTGGTGGQGGTGGNGGDATNAPNPPGGAGGMGGNGGDGGNGGAGGNGGSGYAALLNVGTVNGGPVSSWADQSAAGAGGTGGAGGAGGNPGVHGPGNITFVDGSGGSRGVASNVSGHAGVAGDFFGFSGQVADATVYLGLANAVQNEGPAGSTTTYTFFINQTGVLNTAINAVVKFQAGPGMTAADFVGGMPAAQQTIQFSDQYQLTITVKGDNLIEGDESFTVSLVSVAPNDPGPTVVLGSVTSQTATVLNDDVNSPPTGGVTITGNQTQNQTLTANTSALADANGLGTLHYQWKSGGQVVGSDQSTYVAVEADVGKTITVTVSYTDQGGTAESVTSAATGPIVNVNDPPTGQVTISGTRTEDQTLTASNTLSDPDGIPPGAISYHWQRDTGVGFADIGGATATTYTLGDADVNARLRVVASYTDGHSTAESVASSPTSLIANINDAPVLQPVSPVLTPITEDDVSNAGQTVASIVGGSISDVDPSPLQGIAVIGTVDGNSHWEYRLQGSSDWVAFGSVSGSQALLLGANDFVRFEPDAKNGTSASFTYRAWDQTSGSAGQKADATSNGGGTAFSSVTDTASIAVSDAPDAATIVVTPVVTTEAKLPSFAFFNIASKVSVLDVDTADQGHATNYLAGSGSVTQIDGPTPPDGTLADLLTLDPASGNVMYDRSAFHWLADGQQVVYTITFQAQSNHDAPQTAALTVTIDGLNDAPVLIAPTHATLPAMTEDDTPDAGHTVASFRGPILDGDSHAHAGIAITWTSGNGDWQYSIDGGKCWVSFSACPTESLLLRDSDLIRFAPDGENGGEASFTYRAWDRTEGHAGCTADTTTNGGTSPFSTATDKVTLAVASINDAPVMTPDHMTLLPITEDDVGNAGQPVWTFLCHAISDVDNGAVQGIALTGTTDGNGHWEYSLDGGSSWLAVGGVGENAALLLKADDFMRFVPDEKNGTSATLTYHAWDQTSGTHGQSVDLTAPSATGGTTAFSVDTDTVSIAVSDVNDPPTVSGPVTLTAVNEDTPRLITQAELLTHASDVDTGDTLRVTDLQVASGNGQLVDNHDGTWTYAPAQDDDSSVSFSFNVSDGIASAAATATLDILPVNDAPVAQSGSARGDEDAPITGTVSANDVDTPVGSLTYALGGQNGGAQHGTVTLDPSGAFVYTPDHDFNGTDSFSFTANDGQLDSAPATISITVDPVNDAPVIATGTPLIVAENETFVAALGATDVDGPQAAIFTVTGGADAALFDVVNGNLVFRNARDYETDAHSYQVEIAAFDGIDTTAKLLTINLTDVNDNAPVFSSNANAPIIVPENTTQTVFAAVATDADATAPGNSFAYSLSGDDAALFTIDPVTGQIRFVTAPDYETPKDQNHDNNYQVVVHADDGVHDTTEDVTITVTNINEAPVAVHGSASGEQAIAGQLVATDVDSPTLTYSVVSGPAHGALSVHADGTFSYAADLNYRGADSFSFKANDGALDSNVATLDLNVTQLHLAGSAGNDSYTADAGNERIDAGRGVDTINFNFKLTDATVSFSGNQVIVDGPSGSHTVLTGFEIFKFTDGTVDSTNGNPLIDKLYYYSQYHDVWNAHVDADQHFMQTGWREGAIRTRCSTPRAISRPTPTSRPPASIR
jgi:VCBS repeat-containing protein